MSANFNISVSAYDAKGKVILRERLNGDAYVDCFATLATHLMAIHLDHGTDLSHFEVWVMKEPPLNPGHKREIDK